MKSVFSALTFLALIFGLATAQANADFAWDLISDMEDRAAQCANNDKDKANIAAITKKVNLFGTWTGTLDEKAITAVFSKDSNGTYKGKATVDDSSYGPYTIKICDDDGSFYASLFGYKAKFEVQSKTRIKVYSPLDETETIILRKK